MSRVLAVVGNTIMVHIHEVVPGDLLSHGTNEGNATIVERVERDGELVRLHYVRSPYQEISHSMWMDPEWGGKMFVMDLRGERHGFVEVDA